MKKILSTIFLFVLVFCFCLPVDVLAAEPDELFPFQDVGETHWARDSVAWAYEEGLVKGTSSTKFSPDQNVTVAMFVTMFYRMAGCPDISEYADEHPYVNLTGDEYYHDAVIWFYNKVFPFQRFENQRFEKVASNGDEKRNLIFLPDTRMRREEIAAAMWGVEKPCITQPPEGFENLWVDIFVPDFPSKFTDTDQITDLFDREAMRYWVDKGVIKGRTPTKLYPKGLVTRAEAVTMLSRCKNLFRYF